MRIPPALVISLLLLPADGLAQDSIGLKLFVQPWDLPTDNDNPVVGHEGPSTITDAIRAAWDARKTDLGNDLAADLSVANRIVPGITLHDITLNLGNPLIALAFVSGGGPQPLTLRADGTSDFHLEASFTTPPLGPIELPSGADPRCSVRGKVLLATELTVGTDPDQLLSASRANVTQPVRLSDLVLDHQGLTCNILLSLVDLAGFEDALKQVITQQAEPRILMAFDGAMATASHATNESLAGMIPDGMGRTGAWFPVASPRRIVLAVGQLSPMPDTSQRATIQGTLSGAGIGAGCNLPLSFHRKTGPRPIDVQGIPGEPPLEPLATVVSCDPPDGSGIRQFRVQGLSSEFPNYLRQTGFRCGRDENVSVEFRGGGNDRILSGQLDTMLDVVLHPAGRGIPCDADIERPGAVTATDIQEWMLDPLRDTFPVPGFDATIIATPQGLIQFRNSGAVALNPQPLPPAEIDADRILREIDRQQRVLQFQQNRLDQLRTRIAR